MSAVLIVRPEPSAGRTAQLAVEMGLKPVVAPIFTLAPLEWKPPQVADFDALLLTSANAPRLGGEGLTPFRHLPCYAVGGRTAEAAEAAGFLDLHVGSNDGADMLQRLAADGVGRVFHPCGLDHAYISHPAVAVVRIPVYVSEAADRLPAGAREAIADGVIALIHSARSGAVFGTLAGDLRRRVSIVAISPAAAAAAGPDWRSVAVADAPRDRPMLELAAKLCQNAGRQGRNGGG